MKRLGGLWPKITAFQNLYLAYKKARRGKKRSHQIARFAVNLEAELFGLQAQLLDATYRPGPYRLFNIYERKPRQIAAAPFRDRVVHHALLNIIGPSIDRQFIHDSYACRKGKGVHAAVDRYQNWAKRYIYVLKMDVSRYFPSIDHDILKSKLRKKIKDNYVLQLLDLIIDCSPKYDNHPIWMCGDDLLMASERRRGIPIGNLTSQFFANLYLDELDHFIKERCRVSTYLRYVDDLIILSDDKRKLHYLQAVIAEKLAQDRLLLHPRKAHIIPVVCGVDVLGYRIFPDFRQIRNDNGHRFARKLRRFAKAYAQGKISMTDCTPSVRSWIGHALHGETLGLRRKIFNKTIFVKNA